MAKQDRKQHLKTTEFFDVQHGKKYIPIRVTAFVFSLFLFCGMGMGGNAASSGTRLHPFQQDAQSSVKSVISGSKDGLAYRLYFPVGLNDRDHNIGIINVDFDAVASPVMNAEAYDADGVYLGTSTWFGGTIGEVRAGESVLLSLDNIYNNEHSSVSPDDISRIALVKLVSNQQVVGFDYSLLKNGKACDASSVLNPNSSSVFLGHNAVNPNSSGVPFWQTVYSITGEASLGAGIDFFSNEGVSSFELPVLEGEHCSQAINTLDFLVDPEVADVQNFAVVSSEEGKVAGNLTFRTTAGNVSSTQDSDAFAWRQMISHIAGLYNDFDIDGSIVGEPQGNDYWWWGLAVANYFGADVTIGVQQLAQSGVSIERDTSFDITPDHQYLVLGQNLGEFGIHANAQQLIFTTNTPNMNEDGNTTWTDENLENYVFSCVNIFGTEDHEQQVAVNSIRLGSITGVKTVNGQAPDKYFKYVVPNFDFGVDGWNGLVVNDINGVNGEKTVYASGVTNEEIVTANWTMTNAYEKKVDVIEGFFDGEKGFDYVMLESDTPLAVYILAGNHPQDFLCGINAKEVGPVSAFEDHRINGTGEVNDNLEILVDVEVNTPGADITAIYFDLGTGGNDFQITPESALQRVQGLYSTPIPQDGVDLEYHMTVVFDDNLSSDNTVVYKLKAPEEIRAEVNLIIVNAYDVLSDETARHELAEILGGPDVTFGSVGINLDPDTVYQQLTNSVDGYPANTELNDPDGIKLNKIGNKLYIIGYSTQGNAIITCNLLTEHVEYRLQKFFGDNGAEIVEDI